MVGPKKQAFWPKTHILKGSHFMLKIRGAPVCQKLGMISGNKVVQKLKLDKNVCLQYSSIDRFKKKSFEYVDSWPKIFAF